MFEEIVYLCELNSGVILAPDIGSLCHGEVEGVDGGLRQKPPQPWVRILFDESQSILSCENKTNFEAKLRQNWDRIKKKPLKVALWF